MLSNPTSVENLVADTPLYSCRICKQNKPADAFCKNKARKSGLDSKCRDCAVELNRTYRAEHRDEMNANTKEWRKTHKPIRTEEAKERNRQRMREKYANDPEYRARALTRAETQREKLGPEVLREQAAKYRAEHREESREYHRKYNAAIPMETRRENWAAAREKYRPQRQAANAAYNAKRYGAEGEITNEHLYELHKWQDHRCFYCRADLLSKETIDHVVPLSRDGTNHPRNIVLACGKCNFSKQNKLYVLEWLPEFVAPAPRFYSVHGLRQLSKRLNEEAIDFTIYNDHVQIQDRKVFVLSSFWLGWQGQDYIKALAAQHPRAIILFDKEFYVRSDALINVLKAKAGIAFKTGARKLDLSIPTVDEVREFVGKWHALGFVSGSYYIGLRDQERWWAIAVFREDAEKYEVVRMTFCDTVAGGVSRIIKHFRENIMPTPKPIIAFTDMRIGDGASHFPAGFDAAGETIRTFFYATPEEKGFYPRRAFQKNTIAEKCEVFDGERSHEDNAKANGLMRVHGLPLLRFELKP